MSLTTPMSMMCQPGMDIPPMGSRGVIPVMSVISDWNKFREERSCASASPCECLSGAGADEALCSVPAAGAGLAGGGGSWGAARIAPPRNQRPAARELVVLRVAI